jgi:hypothetical protein
MRAARTDERRKAQVRQASKRHYRRIKDALADYKIEQGCIRCGYDKCAAALDFHHRDPSTKLFEFGGPKFLRAIQDIWDEVDKCDVICKNCHAETHEEKRQMQRVDETDDRKEAA